MLIFKKIGFVCSLFLVFTNVSAQKWVAKTYNYTIDKDIVFGTAVDFGGQIDTLKLDVAYPTNDTPPVCGRPLVLVIYGGAFMAGSKNDGEVQKLMIDFAKRGYIAAATSYRLGMFQTAAAINCNITPAFSVEWNCLNVTDTIEWYRAYYRAIQDTKGAIRYLVNSSYAINQQNVFITGFSAGAITALGAAYLDHPAEWSAFANAQSTVSKPNEIYDNGCVKKYNWNADLDSLKLERPALGDLKGDLNNPATTKYTVKAVGANYGLMFSNLFDSSVGVQPALYCFHQPADLIVPYKPFTKVLQGLSDCAYGACGNRHIINRPVVNSSKGMVDWLKERNAAGKVTPDYLFDSTLNNADCATQVFDPSKGGHQLDNFDLRTGNMATFFAKYIDTADCASSVKILTLSQVNIYPNPAKSVVNVSSKVPVAYTLYNQLGQPVLTSQTYTENYVLDIAAFSKGVYLLQLKAHNSAGFTVKLVFD